MSTEVSVLMWWSLFAGTHVVGSLQPVRRWLIASLSLGGFKAVYSVVSFATFVPLCWVYFNDRHAGALLFTPAPAMRPLAMALMYLALVVMVQGFATVNPIASAAEMSGGYRAEPRGIQRITRHPINVAFALFGLAHVLRNPYASDVLFFGGFIVFALVSAWHQDSRMRASVHPAVREFMTATSMVPFVAIVRGRGRLDLGELRMGPLVVSLAVAAALWSLHGPLFGSTVLH